MAKPGDTMYLAHPDEVERVTLVERGDGGFNMKASFRQRLRKPWVIRNSHGEEGVVDESWLSHNRLAAAIVSARMAAGLERETQ